MSRRLILDVILARLLGVLGISFCFSDDVKEL